ncbi:MAG: thioredoxin [Chloroflexota bacterium]
MIDIPKLSEASFQRDVLESTMPVLVDFTAVWCQPCKMLDPIVRQLAEEWQGKLRVVKLDVDDNPDLATDYTVMGVPTLILFKGGQPVERVTGFQPKDRLKKKFAAHLN